MKLRIIRAAFLTIFSSAFIISCGSGNEIISTKNRSPIVIDGHHDDWGNSLKYFETERAAIGIQNSDEYLYLCVSTADQLKIMKMLSMGITVWLEPVDGKTIGIKYPIQKNRASMIRKPSMAMDPQLSGATANMLKQRVEQIMVEQRELSIVNEDNYSLYAYPIDEKYGFKVALGSDMGQIYYELRIPLALNEMAPVVFNGYAGDLINITIETNEIDISAKKEKAGRDANEMPDDRYRSMNSSRRRISRRGNINDPFEISLNVTLSK